MFIKIILPFLLLVFLQLISANPLLAADNTFNIIQPDKTGFKVNINPGTPCSQTSSEGAVQKIVGVAVTVLFTVGAIGVLIFFLWGAVEWIFSGGDKEQVANARKRITNAMIGLFLLSLSYVILRVVSQVSGFDIFGPLRIPGFGDSGCVDAPKI